MTVVLDRPDWISATATIRKPRWSVEAPVAPRHGVVHPHAPGLEIVGAHSLVPLAGGGQIEYANLDHGASAPALRVVRDTVDALLERYASVHRGAGWHSKVCTSLYEGARGPVREFVGGRTDDAVIFTKHTTDSFNLLAHCLPARTTVVVFETEHHAALLPWEDRNGINVIRLPAPATPAAAVSAVDEALRTRPAGPALLVITGASNVTGEIWPVTALAAIARARGARVALDAAQLAPHRPFSIEDLGVEYVAVSGHKLYAPYGAGALIGRADWLAQARPYLVGGGATATVTEDVTTWKPLPDRHEAGSPNVPGAVALATACHALAGADRAGLAASEQALTDRLRNGLLDVPGVTVHTLFGGQVETIGVVTFTIAGQSSAVVAAALSAEHGIAVRDGAFCAQPLVRRLLGAAGCDVADGTGHAIRASVGLATTGEHVDRLVDAVESIASRGPRRRYVTVDGRPVPAVEDRELPIIAPWQ
ncbi:aminotransferase class V-fold PLP-dependent enzyme [Nakamurella sp. PAMC28650]|uniref:aminotransferase class V-fold PLP-dependent enzyme n=1 Tax=Nakamurella sp. PAMC28650 TaxID=2762325 RepID=UPI00164CEE1D|nr:aminotransferase class V-fold PLP-dependent enzyme [Nakamurella sp. PAMC28650]QNK82721.1 aminotransferase class V-fold PLP-dependent enzyme [Nakamurella sp. PAMC28650]